MDYSEALTYLLKQLPFYQRVGKAAYKTGLDNTFRLDAYFHNPHRHFRTIHVAGTNGKGSVSHMLASILQESGYKVGLYTSPHLLDFRERIKINGKCINKKQVVSFVEQHKSFFDTILPSFFEISVFLAFEHFRQMQVDIAIVEVGLGGRLDSTNIIQPVLSVITNIGKDHTEFLGKTYAMIAKEKAGIIKPAIPVVIGEGRDQTRKVFIDKATEMKAKLVFADRIYKAARNNDLSAGYQAYQITRRSSIAYPDLVCGLTGHYQHRNIVTVLSATDVLIDASFSLSAEDIRRGLRNVIGNTGLYGRWQSFSDHPAVICDTAHNTEGLELVMQQAAEMTSNVLHIIIGFVSDKDLGRIFKVLPRDAEYYFCRLSVPRTMDQQKLMKKAHLHGLRGNAFASVKEAFEAACNQAHEDDVILVTGSTFCVADFMAFIPVPKALQIPPTPREF